MKNEDLIGVADKEVVNGEKVVYEYDEDGNVTGWHKESMTLQDKVKGDK